MNILQTGTRSVKRDTQTASSKDAEIARLQRLVEQLTAELSDSNLLLSKANDFITSVEDAMLRSVKAKR